MTTLFSVVLELTRVARPDDPHAFSFELQGYTLRGPTGGLERFELPWSAELLADLEHLRGPGRDPAVVQRVGEVMQRALRPIGWVGLGERIRAANEAGQTVIVTLRCNAAELYALPWELLSVGASGQHLGELPGVLLRHEWPATATCAEQPAPRREGGRVLFAWSAAGGAVPAAEHLRALVVAWSEGHVGFDHAGDVLAHASPAGLADALAAAEGAGRPFTVLHLLVHGGRAGSTFGLVLDGEDGEARVVDAGRLRQIVAPHAGTLRLVVLAACDGGNCGAPGNHLGSVAQALHRAGVQSVVASRYPLSVAGSIVLAETLYRAMLVDLDPLERAFIATRARLARLCEQLDWASLQLHAREADGDDTRPVVFCPYRGLLVFEARHRRFFFGRDAECREVLGDLQALVDGDRPRFVVVVGASGTGKSSMVLAGVVPDVARLTARRRGAWEVRTISPGAAPLAALHRALERRGEEQPLLLLVDQFEEVFTHTAEPTMRAAFVRELWDLSRGDTGVHVIVTLRVDFLGRCGDLLVDDTGLSLDRVAYDEAHRVFVARMAREQVRTAIEAPAARVGLGFAPGLLERVLGDVGDEPGALPLLQYALGRLWELRRGRVLAAEVYEEVGGLVGALEKDADALVRGLAEEQRPYARRLLTRLVDTRDDEAVDTRRRVVLDQLAPQDDGRREVFEAVLTRLVAARLVVRGEKGGAPTLEVAHEALLRRWATLRGWIAEDRAMLLELDRLKQWARDWIENRTLLTGAKLDRAGEFLRAHREDVDEPIRSLVQASEEERRRLAAAAEGQRRRRRNTIAAVISVLTVAVMGMIGVSCYALEQRSAADRARESIAAERDRARDAVWMAYARRFRDSDQARELQGLLHVRDSEAPGWLQDTLDALAKPRPLAAWKGWGASFSPDGRRVLMLSADENSVAQVWSADGIGEPVVPGGRENRTISASFSPDGRHILSGFIPNGLPIPSESDAVQVWNADGSGEPVVLDGRQDEVSFSPDGRRIVTVGRIDHGDRRGEMDRVRVWDVEGSGEPIFLDHGEYDVKFARFSPDSRRILTASYDKVARVWNADGSGEPVVLMREHWVDAGSFSPDGRRILTISDYGESLRLWNADGSGEPVQLVGLSEDGSTRVEQASFSPDGSRILATFRRQAPRVWAADGSGEPFILSRHEKGVESASFSPDGRLILTAVDGAVWVWGVDGSSEPRSFRGRDGAARSASFSADGGRILAPDGRAAYVWTVRSGAEVVLPEHETWIEAASFSADGQRVLTASGDETVRVWSLDGQREETVLRGQKGTIESADFSSDGQRIVSVSTDRTAMVWNADGSGEPVVLRHEAEVVDAGFSPDGRQIFTIVRDDMVRVWNADGSGGPIVLRGHQQEVEMARFSPDGQRIVSASEDGTARVWLADGSGEPVVLEGHDGAVGWANFSSDGGRVVTTSDRAARVWLADGSGEPVVLRGHEGQVYWAAFSPDGGRIVTQSADGTARVWKADGSGESVVLRVPDREIHVAVFSPDGQRIFTLSADNSMRVWNADGSGEREILRLPEHDSMDISSDRRRVLCTQSGGVVQIWDIGGSDVPVAFRDSDPDIGWAGFSPDGRRILVSSSTHSTMRVWNLDPAFLRKRMADATTFCIPPGERVQYIGEGQEDACAAFTACERKHGRSGECPSVRGDTPPRTPQGGGFYEESP